MPEYMFDCEYISRGTICIEAKSEEEAKELVSNFNFDPSIIQWEDIIESDLEDIDPETCELNE